MECFISMPKLPDGPSYVTGDLWDYYERGYWVVVPTNIGWKSNGENVMGRGMALQAATRFPELPMWYGRLCKMFREDVGICLHPERLLLFPTKPLADDPAMSWKQESSLKLIQKNLIDLRDICNMEGIKKVAMGYPGCGNGRLCEAQVRPLLNRYLNPRFTVVTYKQG